MESEIEFGYRDSDMEACPRCSSQKIVVEIHGYPMAPPEGIENFEAGTDVHGQWYFAELPPWDEESDDEEPDDYIYTTLTGEPAVPSSTVFVRDFIGSRNGVWWHIAGCVRILPNDEFPYQCRSCGYVWKDDEQDDDGQE
jgi:hypothetical protein